MEKIEVLEIPNFKYSPEGFIELKTMLKAGKIVRNPFAKFYNNIEVNIEQDLDTEQETEKKMLNTVAASG